MKRKVSCSVRGPSPFPDQELSTEQLTTLLAGRWKNVLVRSSFPKIAWTAALRGAAAMGTEQDDDKFLGGVQRSKNASRGHVYYKSVVEGEQKP